MFKVQQKSKIFFSVITIGIDAAKKLKIPHMETSARTNTDVELAFHELVRQVGGGHYFGYLVFLRDYITFFLAMAWL